MRRFPRRESRLAVPVLGGLLGLAGPATGQPGVDIAPHPDLTALVTAERAFAADAAAKSMREAFLTWLDRDALVMTPRATPGRAFYERRPATAALLAWAPVYAAVSRSGELGYTTGPWSWRAAPGDTEAAWGDFVSLWRRHDDGTWRVAIDLGVSHPRPAEAAPRLGFPGDGRVPARGAAEEADPTDRSASAAAELRAVEALFAARARHGGANAAYPEFLAEEVRLYREGAPPYLGRQSALAAVREETAPAGASRLLGVGAARAGDLGYAWGETDAGSDPAASPATSWLRIWTRGPEGAWRIVVEVALPIPPEPAGG